MMQDNLMKMKKGAGLISNMVGDNMPMMKEWSGGKVAASSRPGLGISPRPEPTVRQKNRKLGLY